MLNLLLSSCVVSSPNLLLVECKVVCVDSNYERLWVINNQLILVYIDITTPDNEDKVVTVCDLSSNVELSKDVVIGIEYLSEMDIISLATSNGELLTCSTVSHEIDSVGCVDKGLKCMSWSPDQDIVVMVTGSNTLLIMTRDFDPLTEIPIETDKFGEAEPVTVGWGKKETQFHGSLGKKAAQQTTQKVTDPVGSWDDHTPLITWRGDGEYFACSTVDTKTGVRMFRVWTRDGLLHSTSVQTNRLEKPICWRPSGNLIACCQRKPTSYDVIFYESNGLQHGQFTLINDDQSKWIVVELLWNADSTVLGVWLESKTKPKNTTIQLWTSSNHHWYMKQQFCPPSPSDGLSSVTAMVWDSIIPLKLHILTKAGQYLVYQWSKSVSYDSSLTTTSNGAVAVIDGVNLLWTPYRHANVPPPMCAQTITTLDPILLVTFGPPSNSNDFIMLSSKGTVSFIQSANDMECVATKNGFRPVTTPLLLKSSTSLLGKDVHFNIHDLRWLLWIQKDSLLGVTSQSCDRSRDLFQDAIVEYLISLNDCAIEEKSRTLCDGRVVCFYGNHNTGTVIVEFQDGSVYYYKDSALFPWVTESGDHVTFGGVSCDQIALATFQDKDHVIGLNSRRHQLFINNSKVSSCCTSFIIHDHFIIITTDTHLLRFISTHCSPYSTDLNIDDPSVTDESVRRIERGSRIVTAIPNDFRVILQMPRGNLETVCPRALVLARSRYCLDNLLFKEALIIMRKHRLNLNFICDHNLHCFITNARLFVEQVNDVNFINLFLTELKSEDVTTTVYCPPSWYGNQSIYNKPHSDTNKVNLICDALRPVFRSIDDKKYALCLITTHIKKIPQELEDVLIIIKQLKDEAPPINNGLIITAKEAMKYVLQLVEVNTLYDAALGTYDFELVLMVAEKSQKDPKEYLPFLNDLKKLPELYCKYKIDCYLKRYEKALNNIAQCGIDKFDECVSLIKEQKLYKQAITLYKDDRSHERHVISVLYADYLTERKCHKDAAIMYERFGELNKAFECYEEADMWRQAIVVMKSMECSEEKQRERLLRIIAKLQSRSCFADAARILIDYIGDTEEAIKVLVEGKEWVESYRLINLYGHNNMTVDLLRPSLLEAHHNQLMYIEQQLLTYARHVTRLEIVRKEKAEKLKSILDGTVVADERDVDLFSDITSVTGSVSSSLASSKLSRVSNKTAKSQRKTERKKHSLKEGSVHEDVALIEALKHITELSNNLHDETRDMITMLSIFGYETEARGLQETFSLFLGAVQKHHKDIWPVTTSSTSSAAMVTIGPSSTVNDIVASMKTQQSTSNNTNNVPQPVLKKSESWKLTAL